jgi:hypothetical protein
MSNERPLSENPPDDPVSARHLLAKALQSDPDYAWAWHCNLAMPIMDNARVSPEVANRTAAVLMRHFFDIDITNHPHWSYGNG